MPTAVPITFPNPKASSMAVRGSSVENPVMISPNMGPMRWQGSPMSFRILAGSFGRQASFPGTSMSPAPLSASFNELTDFRVNGVPSSLESEAGRILRALQSEEGQFDKDLVQNYSCCGLDLKDLHALLEHFEEVHVVIFDDEGNVAPTRNSAVNNSNHELEPASSQDAFDPDAMELDEDESPRASSTPPKTPPSDAATHTPFDGRSPRGLAKQASISSTGYHTPRGVSPHPINTAVGVNDPSSLHHHHRGEAAFNPYASYADFSSLMPGTVRTPVHQTPAPLPTTANGEGSNANVAIQPALLFSPSTSNTPDGTPVGSRSGTPVPGGKSGSSSKKASGSSSGANGSGSLAQVVSKPFKCPTVGCNKSYKQANGLKYHITHGQCNFMPKDPALEGLSEHEQEEKAKPYVCQVGTCTRRYKNMNGLRYHYQHSGEHGAVGLALLASGQHSLQTGLKEVNTELPSQVKEQHLLAAQALQRQAVHVQQGHGASSSSRPSSPSTPTSEPGSPMRSHASPMPMPMLGLGAGKGLPTVARPVVYGGSPMPPQTHQQQSSQDTFAMQI